MEFTVELPEDTVVRLEERVAASEFDSTQEYLTFVIRELTEPRPELGDSSSVGSQREEEVRDQLRSLGYLE